MGNKMSRDITEYWFNIAMSQKWQRQRLQDEPRELLGNETICTFQFEFFLQIL